MTPAVVHHFDQRTCDSRHSAIKWVCGIVLMAAIVTAGTFGGALWNNYAVAQKADDGTKQLSRELQDVIRANNAESKRNGEIAAGLASDVREEKARTIEYRKAMDENMIYLRAWLKTITDNQQTVLRKQDVMADQMERLLRQHDDKRASN